MINSSKKLTSIFLSYRPPIKEQGNGNIDDRNTRSIANEVLEARSSISMGFPFVLGFSPPKNEVYKIWNSSIIPASSENVAQIQSHQDPEHQQQEVPAFLNISPSPSLVFETMKQVYEDYMR